MSDASDLPEVPFVSASDNPWGVDLLDVRPVTTTMVSTSAEPSCMENVSSLANEDGTAFIGQAPRFAREFATDLTYAIDGSLPDGVLFVPRQMEHKWAIYLHAGHLIFVRSWLREVRVVARLELRQNTAHVTQIQGAFFEETEPTTFTERVLDFLLRSHALGLTYPAPLPPELEGDREAAALFCMSSFGNLAAYATVQSIERTPPEEPLRSISLLHIAVARGDLTAIDRALAAGVPIDVRGKDGLTPLHWAALSDDLRPLEHLLRLGAAVDTRASDGATPLALVVQEPSVEAARILLKRGADPNAKDYRGLTPLHRAAAHGTPETTRLLLERGAAPNVSAEGQTPLSLVKARGNPEIAALLETFGAV